MVNAYTDIKVINHITWDSVKSKDSAGRLILRQLDKPREVLQKIKVQSKSVTFRSKHFTNTYKFCFVFKLLENYFVKNYYKFNYYKLILL